MTRRSPDGFEPWLSAWLATLGSANTRAAYGRDMDVFRAWASRAGVPARRVVERDVERFADSCSAAGASDATVRRRVAAVASFYRHVGEAWAKANPATAAERPPGRPSAGAVTLDDADADRFWSAAVALGPKVASVIGLVLHDGMKAHELLDLDAEDLRTTGSAMVLRRDGEPDLPIDARTAVVVRRYLAGRRSGPLLMGDSPTRTPARLTRHGVDYLVRRVVERAALATPVTVNVLRNTHAAHGRSPGRNSA